MNDPRRSPAVRTAVLAVPAFLVAATSCTRDEVPAPRAEPCTAPAFRPTYLPWLKPGREVPAPERVGDAALRWAGPSSGDDVDPYVSLGITTEDPTEDFAGAGYPTLPVRGTEGYLVWVGDPHVGELSLRWDEGEPPCDAHVLSLLDQELSQRRAEAEIEKIAESLDG